MPTRLLGPPRIGASTPNTVHRYITRDHVEALGGGDGLPLVRLDGELAAPVHRRVHHREHLRGNQGGVVDEQDPALGHRDHQWAVDELVSAVVGLGVLADEVGHRGVAVAGHGDQVGEGRLDQGGFRVKSGCVAVRPACGRSAGEENRAVADDVFAELV